MAKIIHNECILCNACTAYYPNNFRNVNGKIIISGKINQEMKDICPMDAIK